MRSMGRMLLRRAVTVRPSVSVTTVARLSSFTPARSVLAAHRTSRLTGALQPPHAVRGFAASSADAEEEQYEFQTETRQVLDIVTHSLYTDREVFLRELVSNASDALEKARHLSLTDSGVEGGSTLQIKLEVDEAAGTLTISDTGVGMTKEELNSHLGTIARSGTKAFLKSMQESQSAGGDNGSGIIGKFGVGFYSAFMVADQVEVFTKSALPDSEGLCWKSSGDGRYTIAAAPEAERGTRIVLHLKDDAKEFAKEDKVKQVVKKYSSFVQHPVVFGEEEARLNSVQALWALTPREVTEEQHGEFFRFVSGGFGDPLYCMHFVMDAPLSIQAVFYVPKFNSEKLGFGLREDSRVSLYSRKVLISQKQSNLLPEYLRFVCGVADCEDIPLNISRETMQDSALMAKLKRVLTGRVIKFLTEMSKKGDQKKYETFFGEFGMQIKEGICVEESQDTKQKMAPLLRFESSTCDAGAAVSLDDYVERCKEEQKSIYYLCAPSRELALNSTYMEAFKRSGTEVLFMYGQADDFVMRHLRQYRDLKIVNAEEDGVELPGGNANDAEADDGEEPAEALSTAETEKLCGWIQKVLSESKVKGVRASTRLTDSPAMLVGHQSAAVRKLQQVQLQMAAGHKDATAMGMSLDDMGPIGTLEINPSHPIMRQLSAVYTSRSETTKAMAEAIVFQLFDNSKIAAGVLDDPRSMLERLNKIMAAAVPAGRRKAAPKTEAIASVFATDASSFATDTSAE